jgi:hypothetical protein
VAVLTIVPPLLIRRHQRTAPGRCTVRLLIGVASDGWGYLWADHVFTTDDVLWDGTIAQA